jgi:hypothetical protein
MTGIFGPQNSNAALVLPTGADKQRYGVAQTWVQDCSAPGRNDGTVLDAHFYNRIIGNLDYLVSQSGITATPGDMTVLYRAMVEAISGGAPAALNTLRELADAINGDPNFYQNMQAALDARLRFDAPQSLSVLQMAQAFENLGLAVVAQSGAYADLSGLPTLGTASSKDVGTSAGQIPVLDGSARLPAVDGSLLTGVLPTGAILYGASQSLNPAQKYQAQGNLGLASFMRGYIAGLKLTTPGSSASFVVAAGTAVDGANSYLMQIGSNYTKTTSAWAVGSGSGGLDTGAIAANTWYHVFLIANPSNNGVEVCVSLSPTAPTTGPRIPVGYTVSRRIGSLLTDSAAQWTAFLQDGDRFMLLAPVKQTFTNPGTTAFNVTLTTPLGVRTEALLYAMASASSTAGNAVSFYISDLSLPDIAPGVSTGVFSFETYTGTTIGALGGSIGAFTNTSSQVRARLQISAADIQLIVTTAGWIDRRGRDA